VFDPPLDSLPLRVLGCLLEKQLATPEYYPLTLNALVAACNQSTSRDPVMKVDEAAVSLALEELRERKLIWCFTPAGSRVLKYEQRLTESLALSVQEAAVLAELLLRGPQTPGELRTRCTRMYAFQDLVEVDAALSVLAEAETPLARALPRLPGTKETRHAHLLGGPVSAPADAPSAPPQAPGRLAQLEVQVAALQEELARLRSEFEGFVRQFS
jgi:uncharacterized protein